MEKKILKGLSTHALTLSVNDYRTLESMIGCEVYQSDEDPEDNGVLYIMPDGETAHEDFLILETIKYMETGIQLITKEREEQLLKHGKTIESDSEKNDMGQLKWVAQSLITELIEDYPSDWDSEMFDKIMDKTEIERLTIAGALIAAEIDRIQNKQQ
jgi:hypothetical protein